MWDFQGRSQSEQMQMYGFRIIRFDAMASHDITFVGIIQTARASGMEKFPLPYVLTNCHNSLCAVGGTINEDDHVFGLSAAKKYGGIFVPPHIAVIHQYMREEMAGCGRMILGSDKGDIGLSRKIACKTEADVWFPYYPLCHEHDMLENVQMIYECYVKMLQLYKPENIVFLGFSSGGALMLDLITYINELNDSGSNMPMPGLLIPISPGSVPVNQKERVYLQKLDSRDFMIPASYMGLAKEIMCCGHDVPEKYLATAHGDFRNAPMTHFYYGSAETLYAFAPSYAESYRKAGAKCMIHVGKGMHHCYAMQYFIPGCKPAFDEVIHLIQNYYKKKKSL